MRRFIPDWRCVACAAAVGALAFAPATGRAASAQSSAAGVGRLAGRAHRHHHGGENQLLSFLEKMVNELMQADQQLMKDLGKEERHDRRADRRDRDDKNRHDEAGRAGRHMGRKGKEKGKDKDKDKPDAGAKTGRKGQGAGKTGNQVGKHPQGSRQPTAGKGVRRPNAGAPAAGANHVNNAATAGAAVGRAKAHRRGRK